MSKDAGSSSNKVNAPRVESKPPKQSSEQLNQEAQQLTEDGAGTNNGAKVGAKTSLDEPANVERKRHAKILSG